MTTRTQAAAATSKAIMAMQSRAGLARNEVDAAREQLDWLDKNARQAGVDIYDASKEGYNVLPGLEARCNLHEITWINGSIGTGQLLAMFGMRKDEFDAMLPAMCLDLGLQLDGETVSMRPGQAAIDIMNRIDGYIIQHRQAKASNTGAP